ncbi:MAG: hypothetical protein Q7V88_09020 [Actinomycetota bacterium]|nr:hypothetical protein [Actinomycetota bacterium]
MLTEATAATSAPFVAGGAAFARPSRRSVAAWLAVAAIFLLPVRGLFRGVGSSMEEGFMLVFPKRMLQGDLPNRDFLHLYGPGSLHVLAGWYKVFGYSLDSQRVFGLLQHLGAITAVYALCRHWGYRVAVTGAATITVLVLIPSGLAALAWPGAIAFGLWSLVFGLRAFHLEGTRRTRCLAIAGLLLGLALSYRPDLALALGLVWAFLWWQHRRSWAPVAGALVGLMPIWVHVAMVGPSTAWRGMVTDPIVHLRPGRNLPRPPSWSFLDGALQALNEAPNPAPWWRFPAMQASHQLFVWFFVVLAANIGVPALAWWWLRRTGATPRLRTLLAGGLFALGLTGQALQRPDSTHLAWGCCVSFALVPAVVAEWQLRRAPERTGRLVAAARLPWQARLLAPTAAVGALLLVICPYYSLRSYLAAGRVSVGSLPGGFEIQRNDLHFYLGNADLQRSAQAAVDRLDAMSQPGERLLVGPADLSRTVYSDVVFYHLFPELVPATYYIEMDPGLADQPGSSLAADVASADWLILTNYWTGWYEPNTSAEYGSTEPNQVVADDFCLVESYADALVLLYQRCAEGDGVDPATLGIGPERRASMEAEKARRAAAD